MFQKILSLLFGLSIIFFPLSALAYSNTTTHPALTSEMVKFYNNFSDKKINDQQRQWMMDGSSKEDVPTTRTLNHFYDPIYQMGLSGEINAGELTPFIKVLEPMILSAKEWAQNSYAQATFLAEAYKNAALNPFTQSTKSAVEILTTHTWEKAINSYINGNQQDAFENLGHILHLIEDMAVPAHVRNDHHLRGDAYENWAAQFGPDNINVVSQLKNKSPLKFNSLNQYFDYLAVYTNTHFYSQDTIGIQTGYNQPEWNYLNTKILDGYVYSINNDDFGEYFLVKKESMKSVLISLAPNITIDDDLIYSDYWSHLSRQAVLTGSGVIDLFFQEVEKYKNDLAFKEKINEAMIKTTLENIKKLFGNLFGDKQTETANYNFEEITNNANSMNNNSSEQVNEINIPLTPTPQIESLNEIVINPSPFFTPSPTPTSMPTPTPSLSATPLPSPTKTPAPTPTLTPRPTYSPSPSPTPLVTVISSGNSSKTINFCSIFNGIPASNKIIINELAWMGTENSANDEWIELKNISNESINIANWQLIDKNNQIKISFPSKILAPGEFYLLERTDDTSVVNIKADLTFTGVINDTDETLQLFDSHCILQDEAKTNENGQWPAGNKDEKRSMERDADLTWHTYSGEINNGIYGTPKQENSLKIIEPSPSPSPSPSETPLPSPSPSPSSTPTPTPTSAAQILISEILYDSEGSDEGKEFIELYNPNNFEVDLSDWSLRLIKNNETTSDSLGKIETNENHIISPRGFLLIGYNTYSSSTYNIEADILRTSYTLPNPTQENIYTIRLLNKEGITVDEITYQENSCLTGASLERKAKETSTSISMTEGEDQFLGNGYDSDLMTDFIIRSPQPQNSSSLPEPREKPPTPENISYQFTNGGLMLYFSLSQPATSSALEFESFYSYFKEDLSNNFGSSASTILSATIKITKADWMNKSFEGMIEGFPLDQLNYLYLRMRSKDKDGLVSDLSEIIFIEPATEIINQAPIVFYSGKRDKEFPAQKFRLGEFYHFISEESGYLAQINALVLTFNCSMFVKAEVYSVDNGEIKNLIGESKEPSLIDVFWYPNYRGWTFESGQVVLEKNKEYAVRFLLDHLIVDGNCQMAFHQNEEENKMIMDILGYKTALNNLTQKTANHNPLPEEETIFENTISFSAQIFSYNNWPVKLEVELRPRQESFDNQIFKGDPHFFESPYLDSGKTAEITVGGLADGAYHWRARVIDIFGNPSDWYYYGDSQKYYRYNWESPPINIQDNSDFYVDAERTDYPENTLYYQPLAENINDLPTSYTIWYGPDYRIFTFSPHQSGYVDSAEVAAHYNHCTFPMSAELYSLSPDQNDGLPDQLLAKSMDDIPHLIFDYAQPYFESFKLDSWRFDREVYLEAGHFYGLKIKFSDKHNWAGMTNCGVQFGLRKDANNSRVYTMRGGRLYLDFDEDLRLVIYKKDIAENEKAIDSLLDSNNETEQNEMTNSEKTVDENQPLQNDNCENEAEAPLCSTSEIEINDQVENSDAELDTSTDNPQPLEEDSCFEENLLPPEEESVSPSENENILLPENIAPPVETTTSTELINSSDSFLNENTSSLENFSSSDQIVEEEISEETSTSVEHESETESKAIITEEESDLLPDDSETTLMDLSDIEEKTEEENESEMMPDLSEVEEGEKESESGDEME